MRKLLMMLLSALAAAGCRGREAAPGAARGGGGGPVPVVTAAALCRDVPVEVRTFGNVQPSTTVTIRPQVSGILSAVHFNEGEHVEEGQLLCTIDARPAEAAVRQAEAILARDQALLANARKESERQAELFKQGYAAAEAQDAAEASAKALAAAVQAGEAALQSARLQLEYCSIRAPSAGRTGRLMVHAGNLVKADETALVTINRIRPIDVLFSLPQQYLQAIRDGAAAGRVPVQADVPGAAASRAAGELSVVDNAIDPATGSVQLKARFDNADTRLWPGQFVTVVVTLGVRSNAVAVPSQAVQTGQEGLYVFVVKPDRTVEMRPIAVASTYEDLSVVTQGLAAAETVVLDGQQRLVPGAKVEVKTPAASAPRSHP